jgi:hypothetical protein
VIWDGENDYVRPDGALGPSGQAIAATYRELRAGIPAQFIASHAALGEVAILSSLPSLRAEWILARQAETTSWALRTMDDDFGPSPWRHSLDMAADGLAHLGVPVRYLSPEMLDTSVPDDVKLLVLPRSAVLSDASAQAIAGFVARGGVVLADGTPGVFDGHIRQRPTPALAAIAGQIVPGAFLQSSDIAAVQSALLPVLAQAGVMRSIVLHAPDGKPITDVTARIWRNGNVTLLGLQRDYNEPATTEKVVLNLPTAQHATDLRRRADLGSSASFALELGPLVPTILALCDAALPPVQVAGPEHLVAGSVGEFQLSRPGGQDGVVHVELREPAGQVLGHNVVMQGGAGVYPAVFAGPGRYVLRSVDILTGVVAERRVEVVAK